MAKKLTKLEKIRDFVAKNPEQLFIIANPASDEIFASYAGKYTFMKFKDDTHVVMRVVSPDMFELAIDEFASALMHITGTDEEQGVQFIKAVGGSIRSIGEAIAKDNPQNYAKA